MLTLVAMLTLNVTAGGQATHLDPHGVSLLDDGDARVRGRSQVLLAQATLPGDYRPKTISELNLELESLKESIPPNGGSISMLVIGGVLGLGGLGFAYFGLLFILLGTGPGWLIGGLVAAAVGITLVVVGAVLLTSNLRQRRAISRDMEAVRKEIRQLEQQPMQPPPPLRLPVRPLPGELTPPPPPPQAVVGPTSTLLLAEF